jgi:hypothetical protein
MKVAVIKFTLFSGRSFHNFSGVYHSTSGIFCR